MLIDTSFDFRIDTPSGKDPDAHSQTLRRYHKLLWSKPLPNGQYFVLADTVRGVYLHHRSELGESFGQHQTDKGRLYQVKDRRLRHERELDRRLAAGMLDRVVLPKRVTWFVHPTECPPVTSELTRAT